MRFYSISTLLIGALALGCAAKDHHGHSNSTDHAFNATKHACHQMAKLTVLSEIAANKTEADEFLSHHDDQAKAKAKLDGAAAQLKAISANTTLVATCAIVNAHEELKDSCKEASTAKPPPDSHPSANTSTPQMKHLQKFADAATNATLKQEWLDKAKNDTKLESKIAEAASKLQTMQSNTTLVDQCTQLEQEKQADDAQKAASTSAAAASSAASATSMGERVAVGKVWMGLAAAVALGAVAIL